MSAPVPHRPGSRSIIGPAVSAILALSMLAVSMLILSIPAARAAPSKADPDNTAQVALGAKVYAANCASCHGAHLEGQPNWRVRKPNGRLPAPPHDYHGHTWRHPDRQLFDFVKFGVAPYAPPGYRTDMLGFGKVLTDAEIWAVLAFIKSKWPPEFQRYQAAITDRAEAAKGKAP